MSNIIILKDQPQTGSHKTGAFTFSRTYININFYLNNLELYNALVQNQILFTTKYANYKISFVSDHRKNRMGSSLIHYIQSFYKVFYSFEK